LAKGLTLVVGEEVDIGILARRLTWAFWSKTGGWGRSEAGQHELRPDLRGLVGMILRLANP